MKSVEEIKVALNWLSESEKTEILATLIKTTTVPKCFFDEVELDIQTQFKKAAMVYPTITDLEYKNFMEEFNQ
jgi:hypothetical protein